MRLKPLQINIEGLEIFTNLLIVHFCSLFFSFKSENVILFIYRMNLKMFATISLHILLFKAMYVAMAITGFQYAVLWIRIRPDPKLFASQDPDP
jgi:hypothetical protein